MSHGVASFGENIAFFKFYGAGPVPGVERFGMPKRCIITSGQIRFGFRPRYMLVAASLSKVTSKAESATWKNREGILKRFGYILFYFIIFESNSHVLAQICLRFCIDFGQAVVS